MEECQEKGTISEPMAKRHFKSVGGSGRFRESPAWANALMSAVFLKPHLPIVLFKTKTLSVV